MTEPSKDPDVRVIDRRWWARAASADTDAEAEPEPRKPTVVEDLEQQLAEARDQLQGVLIEHRRVAEEFEQAKTRIRREVARDVERSRRVVLFEMLEVADNLDRAIAAARSAASTDASETLLRGVELVREQLLAKLESFGVTRLPALGEVFDPSVHEALATQTVPEAAQDGMVIAVVKDGYRIGDDLLRPASVVVGAHG